MVFSAEPSDSARLNKPPTLTRLWCILPVLTSHGLMHAMVSLLLVYSFPLVGSVLPDRLESSLALMGLLTMLHNQLPTLMRLLSILPVLTSHG